MTPPGYVAATTNPWGLHPRLLPVRVEARRRADARRHPCRCDRPLSLPHPVRRHCDALWRRHRAVGLYEPGTYTVGRKAKWPRWTPTPQMIEREPEIYAQYADGMDPGPGNALGSRALYSPWQPRHLSAHPRHAGAAVHRQSGQFRLRVRMVMPHINDLYDQVETGVTAHHLSGRGRQRGTDGLNMITVKSKHFTLRTPKAGRFPPHGRCWAIRGAGGLLDDALSLRGTGRRISDETSRFPAGAARERDGHCRALPEPARSGFAAGGRLLLVRARRPVETTMLPLRTAEGRPICTATENRPATTG